MGFEYLDNISLEKALEIYLSKIEAAGAALDSEEIVVQDSLGRITSEAVYAAISSPHYNASAMDGIAVCAGDTFGATETTPVSLSETADFIRVDTGDPVPDRFDAVVMIEDVIESGGKVVQLMNAAVPWQHIRQIGEDICAGEMILASGTRIEPAAIGAMLAGGVLNIKVRKKPVVGIIPTGDELIAPTGNPGKGRIIEFNSSIFSAMLYEWGAEARVYGIIPDRPESIISAVEKAAGECDVVLLNAGSSAGRDDHSTLAIEKLGEAVVHGISIKPGKPAILGMVDGRPVIGIPGYPVSGIIVMEHIVKPVLERLMCVSSSKRSEVQALLSRKLVSSLKYREFVRVRLGSVDGKLIVTPLNRGAGVVTSFVKADGILDIPQNSEGYEAGNCVKVSLLRSMDEISNTLVVTGSHDPLIDTVADMLKGRFPGKYLSSTHAGSIAGITAVKRGECHAAGIHLLDVETGEYNTSYIKRYLAGQTILRITCVKRLQGIMTAPGNPKGVRSLRDTASNGLKYVNRQKGSGTRILLDYLLKKEGMDISNIRGYEREEFTHLSVAALVASGSADAGMGIYSAAKAYGLDFIPVCEEQYDFIIPERFSRLDTVECFIEILRSKEFKRTLDSMGGYQTDCSGEVEVI